VHRLSKLNGWWRLWLVLSASWIALVALTQLPLFPSDHNVIGHVGSAQMQIVDVPFYISREEMKLRLDRGRTSEWAYAKAVDAYMQNKITRDQFSKAIAALSFHPPIGWSTGNVTPSGVIEVGSVPRERLMDWIGRATLSIFLAPLTLLFGGLAVGWVRLGFRRSPE